LFIRLFASQAEAVVRKSRKDWKRSTYACCLECASSQPETKILLFSLDCQNDVKSFWEVNDETN